MQWHNPFNYEASNTNKPENPVRLVAVVVENLQPSGAALPNEVSIDNFLLYSF
jgi:hypothetical protein